MDRMVSQILWEHCMGELGYNHNDYENDTFMVRSYDWVDDNNDCHFWHKPSGLKISWYKYPLRGFQTNMKITDAQFLDILRDCRNSFNKDNNYNVYYDFNAWWKE